MPPSEWTEVHRRYFRRRLAFFVVLGVTIAFARAELGARDIEAQSKETARDLRAISRDVEASRTYEIGGAGVRFHGPEGWSVLFPKEPTRTVEEGPVPAVRYSAQSQSTYSVVVHAVPEAAKGADTKKLLEDELRAVAGAGRIDELTPVIVAGTTGLRAHILQGNDILQVVVVRHGDVVLRLEVPIFGQLDRFQGSLRLAA